MDEKYDVIVLGTGLKVCPFRVVSIKNMLNERYGCVFLAAIFPDGGAQSQYQDYVDCV